MNTVLVSNRVEKEIYKLSKSIRQKIIKCIFNLANNPFPNDFKKLSGIQNGYRVRVGQYRILYYFFPKIKTVEVFRVAHRKEAYSS